MPATASCSKKRKRKGTAKPCGEDSNSEDDEVHDSSDEGAAASLKGKESPKQNIALEAGETSDLISSPSSNDVVLGRGKPFQIHPGNIRMRKILSEHQTRYLACRREHRRVYAERLLEEFLERGIRFIKRRVVNKRIFWEPVDRLVALDKLHHFLREKREKNATNEDERGIHVHETRNQSSNVGASNGRNPSDYASWASQPWIETSCESVCGSSVEPASRQPGLLLTDFVRQLGHEPLVIPLETRSWPPSSVSPLTFEGNPIDILLQGGSLLAGDTLIDLDRRRRLVERSVFTEPAALASTSLYVLCSYASLQNENHFEAAFSPLLVSSPIPASATTLTTPYFAFDVSGSSSSLQQLLNACRSRNTLANPNVRL